MKVVNTINIIYLFILISSCSDVSENIQCESIIMINKYAEAENNAKFFRVVEQVDILGRRKNHLQLLEIAQFLERKKPFIYSKTELNQYLMRIDSIQNALQLDIKNYSDIVNNVKLLATIAPYQKLDTLLIESNLTFLKGKVLDALYDEIFDGHPTPYVLQIHYDRANYQVGDTAKVILVLSQKLYTNFEVTKQSVYMTYADGIKILTKEKIGDALFATFLIESEDQGYIFARFIFKDVESGREFHSNADFGFELSSRPK